MNYAILQHYIEYCFYATHGVQHMFYNIFYIVHGILYFTYYLQYYTLYITPLTSLQVILCDLHYIFLIIKYKILKLYFRQNRSQLKQKM